MIGSWDHLWLMPTVTVTFDKVAFVLATKMYPNQEYLSWYWPDFYQTFWTHVFGGLSFWGPKLFWTKLFWHPIFFWPKIFLAKKGHGNCYQSFKIYIIIPAITYLSTKMFISLIAYFCSLFLDQNFFWPKFFGHGFFWTRSSFT